MPGNERKLPYQILHSERRQWRSNASKYFIRGNISGIETSSWRHYRDRNKKWKKNEAMENNSTRVFLFIDYIAPDIIEELEKERENMLEKWGE